MNIYIYKSQLEIKEKKRKFIKPNIQIGKKKTLPPPSSFFVRMGSIFANNIKAKYNFQRETVYIGMGDQRGQEGEI